MRKIFTTISILVSGWTYAQDSLKITLLDEIIFSASRTEQTLFSVPRSATVITSEQIQKSIYNSVGELLAAQEGIYVVGNNQTPGTNQTIFLRGANSNQTAVLIDGKRINDPSVPNAAIDLSELSLTNVERVEIVRGAHTTMYGGSAIGGVINIITKKNQDEKFHGTVSTQAGTLGEGATSLTGQVDLTRSFSSGFYFNGSVFNQNVNGLDASVKTGEEIFTTKDKDDFHKTDFYFKSGFNKVKWDLYASYKKTFQKSDIDKSAFADDDNNHLQFERNLIDYQAKYKFNSNSSLMLLGALSDSERLNENDSSVIDEAGSTDKSYFKGEYLGKLFTNELQFNYSQGNFQTIAGVGMYREEMSFETFYFSNAFGFPFELVTDYDSINSSTTTAYFFGKAQRTYGNFMIDVGFRVSNHSMFGMFFTGEINPSFRTGNSLIYGSLSTAYNAPSLYQLYDPTKDFNAFTTRGNRNLEPEQSLSVELGLKHEFIGKSYLTLSTFLTRTTNAIEYVYLWDGAVAISDLDYTHYHGDTYLNSDGQQIYGFEAAGNLALSSRINFAANASYLLGEVYLNGKTFSSDQMGNNHVQFYNFGTFASAATVKNELTRRPSLLANAKLNFNPNDKLNLNLVYRYAGSRFDVGYDPMLGPFGALRSTEVNAYSLVDLNASYRFSKFLSAAIKAENILDEDYSEIIGYRTRGRSFYLKLLFNW